MKETDLFDLDEMGKEVVNYSCFEWLPGMLYVKVPEHNGATGYINRVCDDPQAGLLNKRKDVFPVLNDPATIGVIENRILAEKGIFLFPLFSSADEFFQWPTHYELLTPESYGITHNPILKTKFEAITEGLRLINEHTTTKNN